MRLPDALSSRLGLQRCKCRVQVRYDFHLQHLNQLTSNSINAGWKPSSCSSHSIDLLSTPSLPIWSMSKPCPSTIQLVLYVVQTSFRLLCRPIGRRDLPCRMFDFRLCTGRLSPGLLQLDSKHPTYGRRMINLMPQPVPMGCLLHRSCVRKPSNLCKPCFRIPSFPNN